MSQQEVKISYTGADPTALGVLGLSMVCFVASSAKLGWTTGTATGLLVPIAIILGGIVQVYAAMVDMKKNNVFGATALGGYGFFWITMGLNWAIMNGMLGEGMLKAVDAKQLAFFFFGYLIFSLFITVASFETNVPFMLILVLIDVLFIALGWGILLPKTAPLKATLGTVAGWSEFAISLLGFYAVGAIFFKNFYGREILPLGKPLNLIKKAAPAPAPTQKISA